MLFCTVWLQEIEVLEIRMLDVEAAHAENFGPFKKCRSGFETSIWGKTSE